jgi:carbonic anhydrase
VTWPSLSSVSTIIRTTQYQTCVERANVEHSLANLRTFPWVRQREQRGELGLHGAWFDIGLGELHVLNFSSGQWRML